MAKDMKPRYQGPNIATEAQTKRAREILEDQRRKAEQNANGRPTFAYFAMHDEEFRAACDRAGIPPTARQASKWHRKRGRAWENRNG